ncbi:MAG: hypothetical protein V4587_07660, partial [Acidobacteriota bacterium]
ATPPAANGKSEFAKPAGENTLLTYLLPDIYIFLAVLFGVRYFDHYFQTGAWGVIGTIVFTFAILAVAAVLTRMRIRLQL